MAHGSAPPSAITSNSEDISLLVQAVTAGSQEEAHRAWKLWFSRVNIDQLPWDQLQVVPTLGQNLQIWLQDDPAWGIFQGFIRRAWTEAQFRLTTARSALDTMEQAGCAPVLLAGPAAVSLLNRRPGSVRPISFLRFLVRRDQLFLAASALEAAGWQLAGELPADSALDWANCVFFSRNEIGILLHWRLLPACGAQASACEAEFIGHHQNVVCGGRVVLIPAPEHNLLAALSDRSEYDPDVVPWQVDAALLPLEGMDWEKWSTLAAEYAPEAFDRLAEMRQMGFVVPQLTRPESPPTPRPSAPPAFAFHQRVYRSMRHRAARLKKFVLRRILS